MAMHICSAAIRCVLGVITIKKISAIAHQRRKNRTDNGYEYRYADHTAEEKLDHGRSIDKECLHHNMINPQYLLSEHETV